MNEEEKIIFETINSLIINKKIKFKELNFKNKDSELKIKIIKTICYKDEQLTIQNLDNYPEIISNSAKLFLGTLTKFDLLTLTKIYSPANYFLINKEKIFKMYIQYSKKELLPFFFMVGFFSFLNLKKDYRNEIKIIQSNNYFSESNKEYINSRKKNLNKIFQNYRDIILIDENKKKVGDNSEINQLKEYFIDYSAYNEIYELGNKSLIIDSLFQTITENFVSILLKKGKCYNIVNILIKSMVKYISDIINSDNSFNDKDIDFLMKLINDFLKLSNENNYTIFVVEYFKHYFKENNNIDIICSFFKGLNPSLFKETFKEIKTFYEKGDFYEDIDKYIEILFENKANKKQESNKIIDDNNNKEDYKEIKNSEKKDIINEKKEDKELENKQINNIIIKDLFKRIDNMESEIKELKNEKLEIKIKMENLDKENTKIKEEMKGLKKENDKLKNKLKNRNKIINDLKEQTIEMNFNHLIEIELL